MKNQLFWHSWVDPHEIARVQESWGVSRFGAEFLLRRGFETRDDWDALDPRLPLSAPSSLPDMDKAVWVIRHVLKQGGRVRVYGDYDADGVTATAVLVRGLGLLGHARQVDWYIPNRFDEGYGLNPEAVWRAHQDGVQLLVTVDCGSSSPEAADLARSLGLLLVITDHHALPSRIPDAEALVNPERQEPVDRLSGAGVALQLVRALMEDEPPEMLYGIAAVGTVADVVPITHNNRRLVARGLSAIQSGAVPGVSRLFEREGRPVDRASASDLGFLVGPRLNAAGRMGDAEAAVRLLLEDDGAVLAELADMLSQLNRERRRIEREMTEEAWERLPRTPAGMVYPFPVIAGSGWHEGVVGIVASRFREWLRRPVAVVAWEEDRGKGSARSVPGFNLIQHLRGSSELFAKLGGHPGAAGFSLRRQDTGGLSARLSENLPAAVIAQQYQGYGYDMALDAGDVPATLWDELRRLEPFGQAFQAPRFLVRGTVRQVRTMGSEHSHLSLELQDHAIRAVGFNLGALKPGLAPGSPVRFLATLETNWYRGEASPQWRMDVVDGGAPRREAAVHEGLPHPLPERVLWVVDADRAVKEWSQKLGAAGYLTSLPIGELMRLEEQARRGMVQQLVVSQWRPWPRLWDWCDAVIWLCRPRNQVKWEESAALAREGGTVWLKSSHDTRVEVKAERLRLTRERLGRHWRLWQRQQRVGLLPGRAVFDELDLHPGRMRAGERRPLEQSHLYRRAVIESMNDVECPFTAPIAGEEEMHGVD